MKGKSPKKEKKKKSGEFREKKQKNKERRAKTLNYLLGSKPEEQKNDDKKG